MFFFRHRAPPDIYTLSLHDALPICDLFSPRQLVVLTTFSDLVQEAREKVLADANVVSLPADNVSLNDGGVGAKDRKSTRLNSSHRCISYAVFCLKKKNKEHAYTLRV